MQNIGKVLRDIMANKEIDYNFDELRQESLNDLEVQQFIKEHQDQLVPDALNKSAANIYEFVTQRNKILNNEDSTVSGFLPQLIVNNGLIDVTYVPSQKTAARLEADELAQQLKKSIVPDFVHGVKLTAYQQTEGRIPALKAALQIATRAQNHEDFRGLYLSGDFGVGKSYLLAGLANELVKAGLQVIFVNVADLMSDLQASFQTNDLSQKLEQIKKTDVLILDDIGAENLSQWFRDDVLGIILQYRMDNVLPTFFSSNFSMTDLENHFTDTKSGEEPVKARRLMERVRTLSQEIVVAGENQRHH